jgi:hypothetical protein
MAIDMTAPELEYSSQVRAMMMNSMIRRYPGCHSKSESTFRDNWSGSTSRVSATQSEARPHVVK